MQRLLLFVFLITSLSIQAQDYQQFSAGAGYNFQSYINLEDGTETQVSNDAWDISFTIAGQDLGVFINESAGSSMGQPLDALQLFFAQSIEFSEVPDPELFEDYPLSNSEKSWSLGAFNESASPNDPLDFGWGSYDTQTHIVTGYRIFVLKLRDATYKKILIESLENGVYNFKYANLDGTDEVSKSIDKTDFAGKLMAYYSITTEDFVDVEPDGGYDMVFHRYTTLLHDSETGEDIPYTVTGILSGPNVKVAQADTIDPETVDFEDYKDSLKTQIDIIGHDWKAFDLNEFQWVLADDRVYFVKTDNGDVWQVQFIDFEGSSTGTGTLVKTNLGMVSASKDIIEPLEEFKVFPNPANKVTHLSFTSEFKYNTPAYINLIDINGRVVYIEKFSVSQGQNNIDIPLSNLSNGLYSVSVLIGDQYITRKISVID